MPNVLQIRCAMIMFFAVIVTVAMVILSMYLKRGLIIPGHSPEQVATDSNIAKDHNHRRHSLKREKNSRLHSGNAVDTRNEAASVVSDRVGFEGEPLDYDQVWPTHAVLFTMLQSMDSPEQGWPLASNRSFDSCMHSCSSEPHCRAFSFRKKRSPLPDALASVLGVERPPSCLKFAFRSCWRDDSLVPNDSENPPVKNAVYEKRLAFSAFGDSDYEVFKNMRLLPSSPRSTMAKRVLSYQHQQSTPRLGDGAVERAGKQCSTLCRRHVFSDGRTCGSFEARTELSDGDGLREMITCFLHTEGIYDNHFPAKLVADLSSSDSDGSVLYLVGAMNNNDSHERLCRT